jgi:hypothetical protein
VVIRTISLVLLMSCVTTSNNNEFDKCKDIYYAAYSEEIVLEEWHKCMQGEDHG